MISFDNLIILFYLYFGSIQSYLDSVLIRLMHHHIFESNDGFEVKILTQLNFMAEWGDKQPQQYIFSTFFNRIYFYFIIHLYAIMLNPKIPQR